MFIFEKAEAIMVTTSRPQGLGRKAYLPILALLAGAAALLCMAPNAGAQTASDPTRLVVPYVPGGSTDILARTLADYLSNRLSIPMVVVNQPGAGGTIGTTAVARSAPNGFTLVMATNGTHAINASLFSKLQYDPVKDFSPITMVAAVPLVLVVPARSDIHSIKDLITAGTTAGRKLNFGSAGIGASGHLAGEMLRMEGRLDANHVPYKGDAQALVDLIGGQIDFMFANMPAAAAHIKAGTIRALAVSTGRRSAELPDVPTVREAGYPSLAVDPWYGVLAPAGTPPARVAQLNKAFNTALQDPDVTLRLKTLGATPLGTTAEEFAQTIAADTVKFRAVVKASGARID